MRRSRKRARGKLVVKQAFRAASALVLSEAEGNKMGTAHDGRRDEAAIISPPCARASQHEISLAISEETDTPKS